MRPLEAIIDTQALIYNLNRARAYSSHSKVMSVLKANAYGHGLIEVARALNKSDGFSVLSLASATDTPLAPISWFRSASSSLSGMAFMLMSISLYLIYDPYAFTVVFCCARTIQPVD